MCAIDKLNDSHPKQTFPMKNPYRVHVSVGFRERTRTRSLPTEVMKRIKTPPTPGVRNRTRTLLISGEGYTNNAGEMLIQLTNTPIYEFLHVESPRFEKGQVVTLGIVAFLLTPIMTSNDSSPSFFTWSLESSKDHTLGNGYFDLVDNTFLSHITTHKDICLKIQSWNFDGASVGSKFFSWLCVAEGAAIPDLEEPT